MKNVVFSKSTTETTWANTKFQSGNVPKVVKEQKSQKGSNILVLGSGTIVQQLITTPLCLLVSSSVPADAGVQAPLVAELARGGANVNGLDDDGLPLDRHHWLHLSR